MNPSTAPTLRKPGSTARGLLPVSTRLTISYLFNPWNIIFTLGIPIVMFLIFGVGQEYSKQSIGRANVSAVILVNMSQYAVIMCVSMIMVSLAIERNKGWLRAMSLTPLGAQGYMFAKLISSLMITLVTAGALYILGFCTESSMEGQVWVQTFLLVLASSIFAAELGIMVSLAVGNETAYSIIAGGTALLAFFSGIFIPLNQMAEAFQTIAKFTPLWGLNQLATAPFSNWDTLSWEVWCNVGVWTIGLALLIRILSFRSTTR
ncbi:ABC transporter permease [Actinotignum urinale]|uniref:ABC transporter permease n=1 Tax=Actinotignum urinale TaxID=190146 RepID=UPI002A807DD6|nr:ABC transporter permease [Actinotignum urinale]MDY5128468.1 ABC transporter permease [Actinotignum urinale]